MGYINKWDSIFENFKMHYPTVADESVDWYPSGPNEVTAKLSDGSRVIFDDMNKTMRFLNRSYGDPINSTEEEWKQQFAQRLRRAMRSRGVTQYELAKRTRLAQSLISLYANGKSLPGLHAASKIANALECSIYELVDFNE